jgi:DNA-binding transcriptional MerR regulator
LLPEPERTGAGYRAYSPDAVRVVRFVKRAQELGFTLAEVEELLELADGGPEGCDAARGLATSKIVDLQARIDDLRAMQDALTRLVHTCERPRARRECPLLAEIGGG